MMNKRKALQQQNNHYEKQLPKETRQILTDIVVYLKSFPISEYQVELVRLDITRMLLEGAARGLLFPKFSERTTKNSARHCSRTSASHAFTDDRISCRHSVLGLAILMPLWMVTGLLDSVQTAAA